jgi:hypothetical protein
MHPYSFVTFGGHAFQGLFSIGLLTFDWVLCIFAALSAWESPIQRLFCSAAVGGQHAWEGFGYDDWFFFAGRNISKSVSF